MNTNICVDILFIVSPIASVISHLMKCTMVPSSPPRLPCIRVSLASVATAALAGEKVIKSSEWII